MKTVISILNMVAVLTLLVLLGLALYLVGSGRLDRVKSKTILDMVRHNGTPTDLRAKVYAVLEPPAPPTTAPATSRPAAAEPAGTVALSSAERIAYTRQALERQQMQIDHEAQELQHRQQLLDQKRAEIDAQLAELDTRKKTFDAEVAATQARVQSAAFAQSLDLYNELKPKQVKDIFSSLPPDAVADFLKAMDPSRAAKVIAEFKAPEEKSYITGVLEKIRAGVTAPGTGSASTMPATAPADANQVRGP